MQLLHFLREKIRTGVRYDRLDTEKNLLMNSSIMCKEKINVLCLIKIQRNENPWKVSVRDR